MPPKGTFEKDGVFFCIGDQILLRSEGSDPAYIAKIDKIGPKDKDNGHELSITWFYRPEDVGRRQYHGERELFMSDHKDTVASACILSKCQVWTLKDYRELETVTTTDFFWRYTYHTATRRFSPEEVPVYCSCSLPENPDIMMAECDACLRWFHPFPCEGVDPAEVQATGKFMCRGCRQRVAPTVQAAALGNVPTMGAGAGLEDAPFESAGAGLARAGLGMPLGMGQRKPATVTGAQLQAWANGASLESSGADALTVGPTVPVPLPPK